MENRPTESVQKRTVDLDRGIFVVRYSAAEDDASPPKVTIVSAPGSDADIVPVLHPDANDPVLWHPGSALVVQALEAGQLVVEVIPSHPKGSAAATVKIETLSQGEPKLEVATTDDYELRQKPSAEEPAVGNLRVIGHVAGRGDVFVGPDQWIGGPTAPSRIEGLAIEWPSKPHGLTLRYAVTTAQPDAISNAPVETGAFAGTRGRALPLVGVALELSGTSASDYEMVVEAVFLGSPISRARGQQVRLEGPTGREPLVGFRLNIARVLSTLQSKSASTKAPVNRPPGRVRVFRSTGTSKR